MIARASFVSSAQNVVGGYQSEAYNEFNFWNSNINYAEFLVKKENVVDSPVEAAAKKEEEIKD